MYVNNLCHLLVFFFDRTNQKSVILQTARIDSFAPIYAFGGRSAVGVYAENIISVQYI